MSLKEVQQLMEAAGGLGALLEKGTDKQEGGVPQPEQLQALLQHVRNQQLCEQLDAQRQQLLHQQRSEQDTLLRQLGLITSHLSQADAEPLTQAGRSYQQGQNRQHDTGHKRPQQAAAAAAVAAANNQQQVHALLQHQINLLQMQQQNQGLPPSMPSIGGNSPVSSNQQHHQQPAAAYHFGSNETGLQQHAQQPQQLSPKQHQVKESEQPQKRRRGRPASSSTRVHPNLVYVRRFRERQKQMENELEATVTSRKQQLQQLQVEQQQLCMKWEALEQVLQVQNSVLVLMQQLNVAETTGAAAAEEKGLLAAVQATTAANGNESDTAAVQGLPDRNAAAATNGANEAERSTANGVVVKSEDTGPQPQQAQQQPATPAFALSEAAAAAAAALRLSRAQAGMGHNQQQLMQQARHWLEPVRLYVLRAAIMLDDLGMLPNNTAALAALAAARSCPIAAATAKQHHAPLATAAAVAAAISAAAAEAKPAAAATAAAAVATAVRCAWDGTDEKTSDGTGDQAMDGVPLVRYPYSIGMYVITPDPIKTLCWPMNMLTWQVDDGNNQSHAEQAGRAMWAVLRPERWRLLRTTWLTMSSQLEQVQRDFVRLHGLLKSIGERSQQHCHAASSACSAQSNAAALFSAGSAQQQLQQAVGVQVSSSSEAGSPVGDAAGVLSGRQQQCRQQQKGGHALCIDGFASMEDSTAFEYAAAAVQVENVLMREDAISFQLCGAFLELLDPLEVAVGFVSSWPYHPQAFTIFDVIFKLGEPPEELPMSPQ